MDMLDYTIVVDTREQKPLFEDKVVVKKLDVGDYSMVGYESEFAIERKEPLDLFSTLTHEHDRFKKEIERAMSYKFFAVVVEGNYSAIVNKDFEGSHHTKMRGYVITSILFTISLKYGVRVFFAKDRREAKTLIRELCKAYLNTRKYILEKDMSLNTE